MKTLRQISDGSIDDIDFLDIPSTFDDLEIKEENHEVIEDIKIEHENSDTNHVAKIHSEPVVPKVNDEKKYKCTLCAKSYHFGFSYQTKQMQSLMLFRTVV